MALVGAVVLLLALPGPSTAKLKARSLTTSQASILDHGFKIKLANTGRADKVGRVRVRTRTFDDPARKPLTKPKRVRVDARSKRRVRLRLTPRGRDAVTACGARELLVEFKRSVKRRGQLQRTSDGCRPGPVDLSRAGDCDFIGQQEGSLCMLPFPDDFYTVADPSTATGRRIDFEAAAMPANGAGTPIAPGPYNLNDGFSPGQSIVLKVSGLDTPAALAQTDPVQLNHLGRYAEHDAPVVVVDATTGERWPIWVELDSNAGSPADTALTINPAVNFASGHRYIVALRDLRTPDGSEISAPAGFRYYRDELPSDSAAIDAQRQRFESIFEVLRGAGIRRSNLYLAWDFTVASDENIAGRMLHIRNDAFATLGDTTMADMVVQGVLAGVQRRHGRRLHRRPGPERRPADPRHLHRPLLHASGLRAGRPFRARRRRRARAATATTRRSSTASFRGSRSTGRRRSRCARRFTAMACSGRASQVRKRLPGRSRKRPRLHSLRNRRDRDGLRGRSQHARDSR